MRDLGIMVLSRGWGRTYAQVGDGSVGAMWEAFVAWMETEERRRDGRRPDDALFRIYRRARTRLNANSVAHPDAALRAYVEFVGKDGVGHHSIISTLGSKLIVGETKRRLDVVVGGVPMRLPRGMSGGLDDLLNILPEWARGPFRAHLAQVRYPATRLPPSAHIGRLCALPDGPIKLRGALCAIAKAAEGRCDFVLVESIRHHCRHLDIIGTGSQTSPDCVTQVLEQYASGPLQPLDLHEPRAKAAMAWKAADADARKLALLVLGADADKLAANLPASHVDADAFQKRMIARLKPRGKVRAAERFAKVSEIVSSLTLILAAIENRMAQLEGILKALAEEVPMAKARLAAGVEVGFGWSGPVVRADGSLGATTQTVRFELHTEGALLKGAHGRGYRTVHIRRRLPKGYGESCEYGWRHDANRWDKLHIVYVGTVADEPGGEVVEPFWVELFRWDVLDWSYRLSDMMKERRRQLVDRCALRDYRPPKRGLLVASGRDHEIALYARGADPEEEGSRLVIPLVEFYHAVSYARVAVCYGIRSGARIGEILQIRLGPDCFRSHTVDGEMQPYLSLRPKGWLHDGKFGLDGETAGAMKSAKLFTNLRTHPGMLDERAEPTLPPVPFCQSERRLPAAKYLFQHGDAMVAEDHLTMFCRVLLLGVIDMRSHDGRYTFATALGLDGTSYEQIGVLLHHKPGSAMPMKYDLSGAISASRAADRFNKLMEDAVAGMSAGA